MLQINQLLGFNVKVAAGFDPLVLSPIMWFDASDDSTVTVAGLGVSTWADKSGNGNDVVQGTDANRPAYDDANDKITFDGVDEWLASAAFAGGDLTQPGEIWVVHALGNTDKQPQINFTSGISASKRWIAMKGGSTDQDYRLNCGSSLDSTFTMTTNITLGVFVANTTSSEIYANGGATIASGGAGSEVLDGITLGADYDFSEPFVGDMHEFILVNSLLSTVNKNLLGNYLAAKWGFTWADIS